MPDSIGPGPVSGGLVDKYHRVATDLRVSLTDRCNLRCTYCMPVEGLPWLPNNDILSDAEVVRLVRIAVELLGVNEVRLTGGEPLLRPGLVGLVEAFAALNPRPEISMTTNGIGLAKTASSLARAGLDRVNVSLDSLDRKRFAAMTHRDRLDDVLAGLDAAEAARLTPVKVNSVLLRGVNDDEAPALLNWAIARGYELRIIEQMPLEPHGAWTRKDMVTADEVLTALNEHFVLTPMPGRGSAPAETFLVNEGPARVGIIASVTRPFCAACDRVRLTADGQVRTCLFAREESDLRTALRAGASDADIADRWRRAFGGKPAGHGIDDPAFLRPARPMSAIGG